MHLITGLSETNFVLSLQMTTNILFSFHPFPPFLPHNSANKQPLKQSQLCKKQNMIMKTAMHCYKILGLVPGFSLFLLSIPIMPQPDY